MYNILLFIRTFCLKKCVRVSPEIARAIPEIVRAILDIACAGAGDLRSIARHLRNMVIDLRDKGRVLRHYKI